MAPDSRISRSTSTGVDILQLLNHFARVPVDRHAEINILASAQVALAKVAIFFLPAGGQPDDGGINPQVNNVF